MILAVVAANAVVGYVTERRVERILTVAAGRAASRRRSSAATGVELALPGTRSCRATSASCARATTSPRTLA